MPTPALAPEEVLLSVAAYLAADRDPYAAAEKRGVSRNTLGDHIRRAKRQFPDVLGDLEPGHGGQVSKGLEGCAPAFHAWITHNRNAVHAARALGVNESTIRRDVGRLMAGLEMPDFPEVAATLDDDVAAHRNKAEEQAQKARFKDALKRIRELDERCAKLEWAAKATLTPSEWTLRQHDNKPREHIPMLLTSDFQIGEVIRAEATEAGYGYDTNTFRQRYRQMIDTAIYLSVQHGGSGWHYPGFIYLRGGDTLSGGIHDELRETDDLTPIEAVEVAFEEEAAGIRHLAEAFGKVEVKTFNAGGNHDRDTLKPRSKLTDGHSYDRLAALLLRREFNSDPRVVFHVSPTFDIRFPVYDKTVLLTHGHLMGSRGGQGFVGPAATILRGVQKVFSEQGALGFHIDMVLHGHFHYPMALPFLISNGCMPGYSEYAKTNRMRPTEPQQMLTYHHPRRGVVDYKPIILTENPL